MANGRMLQRKISVNADIPRLVAMVDAELGAGHGAYAALTYTWCIAHLDCEGRMHGDPVVVKSTVLTRIAAVTPEHVHAYLLAAARVGLVDYYEAEGDRWLAFPGFDANQPGLRKDREADSTIPGPETGNPVTNPGVGATPELLRSESGVLPDQLPPNRSERKRRERKADFDFEAVYTLYPRKEGKARGLAALARSVKTQDQYDRLLVAARNYAAKVRREGTETQFVKHFSSWVSCWEDYADQGSPTETRSAVPDVAATSRALAAERRTLTDEERAAAEQTRRNLFGNLFPEGDA